MSTFEGKNLTKVYGKQTVLDHVDITLETGKIYGLIGRNGAGKTTLLSLLTAQNPATEGTVTLDGEPVWENEKALEKICYSRELSPVTNFGPNTMKVKDYLKIARAFFPCWDQAYADRLVKLFELDVKKRISKLSKGMLSAVTIVVAMASKSPITILDEPVAGLDVVARENFYKLVIDEYSATGRTFIISTHIIEEAASLFEEVIILDQGKIMMEENTEQLLSRAFRVSGETSAVDSAILGKKSYNPEVIGRNKVVTVLVPKGENADFGSDVSVEPVNLQNLFYAISVDAEKGVLS